MLLTDKFPHGQAGSARSSAWQNFLHSLVLCTSLTILFASIAQAQTGSSPTVSQVAPLSVSGFDAVVGAGDLVEVRIFDVPELSSSYRVSGDGQLDLPLIGKLQVAGMSPSVIATQIADRYRTGGFILHPQVTLRILEFTTLGITIEGEVKNAGVYPFHGPRSIIDALAQAGGITAEASTQIQVEHRSLHTQEVVTLPFEGLRDSSAEMTSVYPGDIIFVPKAGVVYVLGEVVRPGGIIMRNGGRLSVLSALSEAQGLTHLAAAQNTFVLRKQGGSYERLAFPLKPYLQGRAGDPELKTGDVLVIPTNGTKLFFQETSSVVASLAAASLYALAK